MPSKKVLESKQQIVADLTAEFKDAQAMVFADYRGLTVEQDTQLRSAMRKAGVSYKVIKNSLSSRAMKEAGYEGLDEILKGPTAIAYSKEDVIAPAKVIKEFAGKYDKLEIKGGTMEGKLIELSDINRLASIPPVEVLYGQVVCGLISPIAGLAMLLNAVSEKAKEANAADTDTVAQFAVAQDAE
ncbi:MAG: large subunit ribosomal protein [Clostridiales bacterium]|jgi:large subunit ribosomal protein L10|nr:large subunit ribosomal protein [Clostridiales bacterium]